MNSPNRYNRDDRQSKPNPATQRSALARSAPPGGTIRFNQSEYDAIPMEYRAQVQGRCQRQFVQKRPRNSPDSWRSDIQRWHEEWLAGIDKSIIGSNPENDNEFYAIDRDVDWRLISNSGSDEGFIRPAFNSRGWPIIPGSSFKGLFCRQWLKEDKPRHELDLLCGSRMGASPLREGGLRFHGAILRDLSNIKLSLDLTFPQEAWQIGFSQNQDQNKSGPASLISLLKPRLRITISRKTALINDDLWKKAQEVLERSLNTGLGGRTSAGYGRISKTTGGKEVFTCTLRGQGIAPKLLDIQGTAEFRPVSLRASIRAMAMRLFAGLVREDETKRQVEYLFGGLSGPTQGLLACRFIESRPTRIGRPDPPKNKGHHSQWDFTAPSVMNVEGRLTWEKTYDSNTSQEALLINLLASLHGLVMSLGGFSKGWRRADHRMYPFFRPQSDDTTYYRKTPIGCHWDWIDLPPQHAKIRVNSIHELEFLVKEARRNASIWLRSRGTHVLDNETRSLSPWREVIHPAKMRVWARTAASSADCRAINWFHHPSVPTGSREGDMIELKKIDLMGQSRPPARVGRIWHRMLPIKTAYNMNTNYEQLVDTPSGNAQVSRVPVQVWEGSFLEIITFFTGLGIGRAQNDPLKRLEDDFLDFMDKQQGGPDSFFTSINFKHAFTDKD
jgi:CRISPR-associated protein Cmr6